MVQKIVNATNTLEERIHRIWILILMQVGDGFRLDTHQNKMKFVKKVLFGALASIISIAVMFFLLSYVKGTMYIDLSSGFFVSVLILSQTIGIISSIGLVINSIFEDKSNKLMIVFPCTKFETFASKMLILLGKEFKKSLFFTMPFLIAFGIIAPRITWVYWLMFIPTWLSLVCYPIFIGAALSVLVFYTKRFLKQHPFVFAAVLVLAFSGLMYVLYLVLGLIPDPLRIVAIYDKFVAAVNHAMMNVAKFGSIYYLLGEMMFAKHLYFSLPGTIICVLALLVLANLLVLPFYYRTISLSSEDSGKIHKTTADRMPKSHFAAFMYVQWIMFKREAKKLNGMITLVFTLIITTYIMNYVVNAINQNTLGQYIVVAFNIMIILSILTSYGAENAAAFSSEGAEFALLKTAPMKIEHIGLAKITLISIMSTISLIIEMIMLSIITDLNNGNITMMFFVIWLLMEAHIVYSCQLDINHPKIIEYAIEGSAVTDNSNIRTSLLIGAVLSLLTGVVVLLLLMDNYLTGWIRIVLITIAFFAARFYLFYKNLVVYFGKIEM